jgi:hypothetical protein
VIPNEEEFKLFFKTLQDKLPVTFRINPSLVNYQSLVTLFSDPKFTDKYWIETKDDSNEKVLFYSKAKNKAYRIFSNFSPFPIEAYGRKFKTSENFY